MLSFFSIFHGKNFLPIAQRIGFQGKTKKKKVIEPEFVQSFIYFTYCSVNLCIYVVSLYFGIFSIYLLPELIILVERNYHTCNETIHTLSSSGFPTMLRSAEYISAEKHCGVSKCTDKLPSLESRVNHEGMLT